jgi:uracil-DNA glycosylase
MSDERDGASEKMGDEQRIMMNESQENEEKPRRQRDDFSTPTSAPSSFDTSELYPRPDLVPGAPVSEVKIEPSWKRQLVDEFSQPYMQDLRKFLKKEMEAGERIYPKPSEWFAAFDHTPFEKVKVVILGQDPYHGPDQAHGLCFSVRPGVRPPPSLLNIFKEMKSDLGIEPPDHGYLISWADQGVLLLNSVLTVREGQAASHQKKGWEKFTDKAVQLLNDKRDNLVFVLWGAYAQKKGAFIDRKRHLVLEGVHPSPLSASRGFFGSRPFSKINKYLVAKKLEPIDWQLPPLKTYRY